MKKFAALVLIAVLGLVGCTVPEEQKPKPGSPGGLITATNNQEFAAILAGPQKDKAIAAFVDKYGQSKIEFDGYVESKWFDSYYDDDRTAVIRAGEPGTDRGPRFSMDSIDSKTKREVRVGQRVHVTGTIGIYEHDEMNDTFTHETNLMRVWVLDSTITSH